MNPLWIGALIGAGGTLLGAVTGGVLSYLNTRQQLKYQRAKEYGELRRGRLEELVVKLEQTSVFFSGVITYLLSVKPPEKVDQDRFIGKTPFHAEVMMLTLIYAPELMESYGEMIRLSQEFAGLANTCRNQIDSGEWLIISSPQAQALFQKEDELTKSFVYLSLKVSELARELLEKQSGLRRNDLTQRP